VRLFTYLVALSLVAAVVAWGGGSGQAGGRSADRCELDPTTRTLSVRLRPHAIQTSVSTRPDGRIVVEELHGAPETCADARLRQLDLIRVLGTGADDGLEVETFQRVHVDAHLRAGHDWVSAWSPGPVVVDGRSVAIGGRSLTIRSVEHVEFEQPHGLDASAIAPGVSVGAWEGSGSLIGGPGDDMLTGGDGPVRVEGGPGDDVLYGGRGFSDDVVLGGPGDDRVGPTYCECWETGDGADRYAGGAGHDHISYSERYPFDDEPGSPVVIRNDATACSGADVDRDGDACDPGDEHDIVVGFESFLGGWGEDTIIGAPGVDETFWARWGSDTFVGNAGDDETLEFSLSGSRGDGVSVDLIAGVADGPRGGATFQPVDAFTTLIGSSDPDVFLDTGEIGRRYLAGRGADRIEAGGGADEIWAGLQPDVVIAGGGDDRLRGEAGDDRLTGGAGADRANGGNGNDRCVAEVVAHCEPRSSRRD
jgi:Ca2+-binding RTX toxin-like protein